MNNLLTFTKVIGLLVLGIVTLFFLFLANTIAERAQGPVVYPEGNLATSTQPSSDPYHGTLRGVVSCLPPEDISQPSTLECRSAIETENHEFYALDYTIYQGLQPVFQNGDLITIHGRITPIENLSNDMWQKYNVKGIVSVTSVE